MGIKKGSKVWAGNVGIGYLDYIGGTCRCHFADAWSSEPSGLG